jgi:hypothetical protein
MNSSTLPSWAFSDQGSGAVAPPQAARSGIPFGRAAWAPVPSGRADRAATRADTRRCPAVPSTRGPDLRSGLATKPRRQRLHPRRPRSRRPAPLDVLCQRRTAEGPAHPRRRRHPGGLHTPGPSPARRTRPEAPRITRTTPPAGASGSGMPRASRVAEGGWLRWKHGHSVHRRGAISRAEHARNGPSAAGGSVG